MKKILLSVAALSVTVLLASCGEDGRLDQFDDSIPTPQPVEITEVTPTRGGAVLKVKIPDDDNLKGVVAVYNRNGQDVETKISRYVDTLAIEGYADVEEHEVKVYSFNANEKRSEPVEAKFTPLVSAIKSVDFDVVEGFGGVKVHINNNDSKASLAVCILACYDLEDANLPVSQIRWNEIQTLYTSADSSVLARRNLESKETIFGIYIRDHWGNISDTIKKVLTPWYEEKLDRTKFSYFNPGDDNSYSTKASYYPIAGLWDGSGASSSGHFYASAAECPMPQWLTIDLGVTAKLSRIGKYARIDYNLWTGGHPREYEFWGSATKPTGATNENNEHGFEDCWVKLGYFEQYKPSGYNGDGSVGTITEEDRTYFNTGTEFELDSEEYPHAYDEIRYLRLVIINTFATYDTKAKIGAIQLGEIIPYGQVISQ